ncbi:putative O-glycosylation ligase, exosortase A system-associated [Emcibacter sp.]|uniref:putative O-glycosylation ligase, exosortase A system-associated n=1 Tax=Emcibacter sp. TaxID=1979954 RepID=UPI002AA90862|nr:putative O-glycosylation ligase, exosortase A system-associated [Emcibacter sp.]
MRDIFLSIIIFGLIPFILKFPHVGVLAWSWISYMNPHKLAYGFAYFFNFLDFLAAATILALLATKDKKSIPKHPITWLLALYVVWISISTLIAVNHEVAIPKYITVIKILLFTFVTMLIMQSKSRINALVWVIVLSIGFYAFKGGIFTLATGGGGRVWGAPGSFFGDNNHFALVLLMVVPLTFYLYQVTEHKWLRFAIFGLMMCEILSIFGTQSRGALIGMVCMFSFWAYKTKKLAIVFFMLPFLALTAFFFMPDSWKERMTSIEHYDEDASAQGRITMWRVAIKVANDNPVFGGGFNVFYDEGIRAIYLLPGEVGRAVHSVHFEVIGEQGYAGYLIFLLLALTAYATGNTIRKQTKDRKDLKWCGDLAEMIQVSMIGYASAGAFVNLATFDLYYHLLAIMAMTRVVLQKELDKTEQEIQPVPRTSAMRKLKA